MRKISIALLLAASLGFAGCNQNEMNESQVGSSLYFAYGSSSVAQKETASVSFAFLPQEQWCTVVPLEIVVTGPMVDHDRAFPLVQIEIKEGDVIIPGMVALPADKDIKETKAWLFRQAQIAGEDLSTPEKVDAVVAGGITAHYVAFDHPKLMEYVEQYSLYDNESKPVNNILPAGEPKVFFPVLVLRDPSMSTLTSTTPVVDDNKPVRLKIGIETGGEFDESIHDNYVEGRYYEFTISATNLVGKPSTWNEANWAGPGDNPYFSSWGPAKFQLIIDATGFTDWELKDHDFLSMRDYVSLMKQLTNALIEIRTAQSGPIYEPVVEGMPYSGKEVTSADVTY